MQQNRDCDRLNTRPDERTAPMARIKDVIAANVSTNTVSLVLQQQGIRHATPDQGRAMFKSSTTCRASRATNLSLNHLISLASSSPCCPFFAALLHEIEIALCDYLSDDDLLNRREEERQLAFLEILHLPYTISGLIISTHTLHIGATSTSGCPVIAFDRYTLRQSIIRADHHQGGQLAANALLKRHPHHVVQVTGINRPHEAHEHEDIFAQVIKQASVPLGTIVMPANALQPKDFSAAAREVFGATPTSTPSPARTSAPSARCVRPADARPPLPRRPLHRRLRQHLPDAPRPEYNCRRPAHPHPWPACRRSHRAPHPPRAPLAPAAPDGLPASETCYYNPDTAKGYPRAILLEGITF